MHLHGKVDFCAGGGHLREGIGQGVKHDFLVAEVAILLGRVKQQPVAPAACTPIAMMSLFHAHRQLNFGKSIQETLQSRVHTRHLKRRLGRGGSSFNISMHATYSRHLWFRSKTVMRGLYSGAGEHGCRTIAQSVVQVWGHSDGGQPQVDGLLEAGSHAALEALNVGSRGLGAHIACLPAVAVVGHIALHSSICLHVRRRHALLCDVTIFDVDDMHGPRDALAMCR